MPSVTRYTTTLSSCSCPDWHYRPHRRPCKHVLTLQDAVSVVREWQDKHGRELMPKWSAVISDGRSARSQADS